MEMLLSLVLLAVIYRVSANNFSCSTISTHSCSCSIHTTSLYELLCPQLQVQINLHDSVQLQCINEYAGFSTLAGLDIGDVERFVLRLCPLPDTSIRELMSSIGIKKIKMLQIQSYSNYNDTLKKKHFEKLYEVTNLSLNNNGLTSLPSDIFEDMGNLTWLDMKHNYIEFPKEIFYFTPKLEVLELGMNNLTYLNPGIFKGLERLRLLNLWGNKLANLSRTLFSDVPNLESLDLNSNQMETIRPDLFADLHKLKRLNLYANAFISLPQGLLSRNLELEEFQMQENRRPLVSLPPGFLSNLTELKMVKLSGCKLTSLPENTFSGSKNIEKLYLNRNSLTTLSEKTFIDLVDLEFLDLSLNKITHLPVDLFKATKKLKFLILCYNHIMEIPPLAFLNLKKLEHLDLRFNKLKKITGTQFATLESLKSLNISDNQLSSLELEIQLVTEFGKYSVLKHCNFLEDLQLANNSLTEIYDDWRLVFNKIHTINLAFNHIKSIEIANVDFFSDVTVDLSHNNISLVNFWEANLVAQSHLESFNSTYERDALIKRKRIKLDNNPFNCDCLLLPFVQFIQTGLSPEVQYIFEVPVNNLRCKEPMTLEKMPLSKVPQALLTCPFTNDLKSYVCPEGCSCEYRTLDKGNIINCQNKGLMQLPNDLPLYEKANHSELNFEGNFLRSFKNPGGKGYANVTVFILSNNDITNINVSGVSQRIQELDISNNNLTMLTEDTIKFLEEAPDVVMTLHSNPWHCDCEAKPFIRLVKNRFKQVRRLNNVTCSDGVSLENVDESNLCPEVASSLVVLCIIFAVFGFLVAVLTALYYHYQTLVIVYLYSSNWKVLKWLVTQTDIDDSKEFDAFISFSDKDWSFVTEKLVPFLEEEQKFKLCLHYRNFIGGEFIPDQILRSVQKSRRTVVVLSPNFLNSVWGIAEFKTAHAEALKNGTSRVVVILYEDIGPIKDLDEDLQAYLKLNTYIKWGSPWFYKQLVYALPHPPKAEEIKFSFCCLPRISKTNVSSQSHEVLKNIQLKNGEVHYVTEPSEKVPAAKDSNTPSKVESTSPLIVDIKDDNNSSVLNEKDSNGPLLVKDTKDPKNKQFSPNKCTNAVAVADA